MEMDELDEAIQLLPQEDKVAYLEALKRAPHIVRSESDPIRFLRVERYDFNAAASRLLKYWTRRKEVFQDRAHLPMLDLTGNGAMENSDVDFLSCGVGALLALDRMNRPVTFVDLGRVTSKITETRQTRLRAIFYWYTMLSIKYETSQTEGVVAIRFMRKIVIDGAAFAFLNKLVDEAMPMKIAVNYFCILPPPTEKSHVLKREMPVLYDMLGKDRKDQFLLHVGDSPDDFPTMLAELGLSLEELPAEIGGKWSYDVFNEWFEESRRNPNNPDLPHQPNRKKRTIASCSQPDSVVSKKVKAASVSVAASPGDNQVTGADDASGMSRTVLDFHQEQEALLGAFSPAVGGIGEAAEMIDNVLGHLHEAVIVMLHRDKAPYLEALRRVPHIIESESSLIRFLRLERYDPEAAALRLVKYWKNRLEIYGERAFRPIITSEIRGGTLPRAEEDLGGPERMLGIAHEVEAQEDLGREEIVGLHRALGSLVCEEKAEYMEAIEVAPQLVEKESDPSRFLRREGQDPIAAARRLAQYWRERRALFGERAYRPMSLLSDGTLTESDLRIFGTGVAVQLPDDDDGRAVVCIDFSRFHSMKDLNFRICLFYLLTRISMESTKSQTDGVLLLYCAGVKVDLGLFQEAVVSLNEAMPVRMGILHVCRSGCLPESVDVASVVASSDLSKVFGNRIHVHACSVESELLAELKGHGLSIDRLPSSLGGDWLYGVFDLWLEEESSYRWQSGGTTVADDSSGLIDLNVSDDSDGDDDESAFEVEHDELEEEVVRLQDENARIAMNNERLARTALGLIIMHILSKGSQMLQLILRRCFDVA